MIKGLWLIICMVLVASCSSKATRNARLSVNPSQKMTVLDPTGKEIALEKGSSYPIGNRTLLFQKPGHVSVLLVPVEAKKGSVDLRLKPIKEFGGPELDRFIDVYLTKLMTKVTQVQESMASRNYSISLQKIKALQVEYPNLVYLQFLEASCLTLMGEKIEAQSVLSRALEVHPNNPEGRRLNRYLSGGPSSE